MTRLLVPFFVLCCVGGLARGADTSGLEEAFAICESMGADSDKTTCHRTVRNQVFDARAVRLCSALRFADDKNECLAAIAGKVFPSERELNICGGKPFTSDKLSCLREAGATPPAVVVQQAPTPVGAGSLKDVRESITEALSALENNHPQTASRVLQKLLHRLPKQ
jgi:hypothetical protein